MTVHKQWNSVSQLLSGIASFKVWEFTKLSVLNSAKPG